jgi:RNA polymerase sigma factor (sigma-70 family)
MTTNEILWEQFLIGDKDALSNLFNNIFDDLYGYGMKLAKNQVIVNDSIQDMFLKIWKNRNNLGKVEIVKPYLCKALRRHIVVNLRCDQKFVHVEDFSDDVFEIEFSYEDFIVKEQSEIEQNKQLSDLLNKLSDRQKEAIYLRYFMGYEFEKIADIMSMNVQSVRNTIHRGVQSLRELIPLFLISVPFTF